MAPLGGRAERHANPADRLPPLKAGGFSLSDKDLNAIAERLDRLLELIERAVPPAPARPDFAAADAFVWLAASRSLQPVEKVNRVDIDLLKGIDRLRDILKENTERFQRGLPANNALLWGARGMGKSSLVKAVHAGLERRRPRPPAQAHRDPPRGHRDPARPDGAGARRRRTASSSSATISPSTATIPRTNR